MGREQEPSQEYQSVSGQFLFVPEDQMGPTVELLENLGVSTDSTESTGTGCAHSNGGWICGDRDIDNPPAVVEPE